LVAGGEDVVAQARSPAAAATVQDLGASPLHADLFDEEAVAEGMRGCDVVYHVAGINELCTDPAELYRVNVGGPSIVVDAASRSGVSRVVVTSSVSGIGAAPGVTADETTPSGGVFPSNYARSKHEGERAALATGARLGVEVVAVLPASVQGAGRTGIARRIAEYTLRKRNPLILDTRLSLVDLEDCAEGHIAAAERGVPGSRYILSGAIVELRRMIELIGEVTGTERHPVQVPRWMAAAVGFPLTQLAAWVRPGGPVCPELVRTLTRDHQYDGSRATRELGLTYTPIEDSIERVVAAMTGPREQT
jgi:dihydroflavonol-4-reductase